MLYRKYILGLIIGYALLIFSNSIAAEDHWWGKEWHYRISVEADAGMKERKDALVVKKIDFSKILRKTEAADNLDIDSIRLIEVKDNKLIEVPYKVYQDKQYLPGSNETVTIAWQMDGITPLLGKRFYQLYFDTLKSGKKDPSSYPPIKGLGEYTPGENIIKNGDFSLVLDKYPVNWDVKDEFKDKVCVSTEVKHNGKNSLKILSDGSKKRISVTQKIPLMAGKKYTVSAWIKIEKAEEGSYFWLFVSPQKKGQQTIADYYRYTVGRPYRGKVFDWTYFETSKFHYGINPKTGKPGWAPKGEKGIYRYGDILLPGTTDAHVSIQAVEGKIIGYITDIKVVEALEDVQVDIGDMEEIFDKYL